MQPLLKKIYEILHFPAFIVLFFYVLQFLQLPANFAYNLSLTGVNQFESAAFTLLARISYTMDAVNFLLSALILVIFTMTSTNPKKFIINVIGLYFFTNFIYSYFFSHFSSILVQYYASQFFLSIISTSILIAMCNVMPAVILKRIKEYITKKAENLGIATFQPSTCMTCKEKYESNTVYCSKCLKMMNA